MKMRISTDLPSLPCFVRAGEATRAAQFGLHRSTALLRQFRAFLAAAFVATTVTMAHAQSVAMPAVPPSYNGRLGNTYGRFGDNAIREALRGERSHVTRVLGQLSNADNTVPEADTQANGSPVAGVA